VTKQEFAEVIAFLELATGKPIHDDPAQALSRTKLYFQMLGDLPLESLRLAAERLVCERKWASFPQVAELRELAASSDRGEITTTSAGEAWGIAIKACADCDIEVEGSVSRSFAKHGVTPMIEEAIRRFGFMSLYNPENMESMRAQFRDIWNAMIEQDRRVGILPQAVRERITKRENGPGTLSSPIAGLLRGIGVEP
jgi:hypothetical protein